MFWMWTTIGAGAVATLVAFERWTYDPPEWTRRYRLRRWLFDRKMRRRHFDGCAEKFCFGVNDHGPCVLCGELTCSRHGYVDEALRRRVGFLCSRCLFDPSIQSRRYQRVKNDWQRMTTPVMERMLVAAMGEQYPGPARAALRAFSESRLTEATVPDVDASTLQASLSALGLNKEMYAEQRGHDTILRRIALD